jgi:hypothetical protein
VADFDESVFEQDYAELYAVASIIYYGGGGHCTGLTDAQFDGLCSWLLQHESWRRVPWLEHGMLKAGSGYDLAVYPGSLRERAEAQVLQPCACVRCMCSRREINDPEVYERLGIRRSE